MGTQLPLPKGGRSPQFSAKSVVAKWLDGSRCHLVWRKDSAQATVLDGDPAPLLKKGAEPPANFRPIPIVAKRLDASIATRLMEVSFSPGEFVLDGDPAPYPKRGGAELPPQF